MVYFFTDDEGEYLVKLARKTVETVVRTGTTIDTPPEAKEKLFENSGVFVTLEALSASGRRLRGCIGHPYPDSPLIHATIDSAVSAAMRDPRFSPVKPEELDQIVVEVSILTPPELIQIDNVREYPNLIEIGRDGLIVDHMGRRGLLLPQVAVEWKWDAQQFLEHTCEKAWLTADMWLDKKTKIYKFQAEIFHELTPNGKIEREAMKKSEEL
ncbi:MAG: TIGR00296 family protein [Promethearchaeota archaeon]|nr:MAG: TIGR00296 family protein [Candidatus Lokiarchaeota archaeon]